MKFSKANRLIFALVFFLTACHSSSNKQFKDVYYQKSNRQWLAVLHSLGYKKEHLRNHILLVMHTTECPPCLQELAWWNKRGRTQTHAKVLLLLTEKHKTSFKAFLKFEAIEMPSYRDSSGILFNKNLIPTEPIKIYINKRGKVELMYHLGDNGKIRSFLTKINTGA